MGTVKDARKKLPVNYVLDSRWKITKVLGEGAFGAVYEVSDMERPGKLFALKVSIPMIPPFGNTSDASVLVRLSPISNVLVTHLKCFHWR